MEAEDCEMESSIPSLLLSLMKSKQMEVLSAEDIAWVDSCLVKDPENSNGNWDSLKDALLEILSSQPESLDSSASVSDGFPEGTDVEILPSNEEAETVQFQGRTENDLVLINEEAKTDGFDFPIELKNNTLQSLAFEGNPFLPTYTEGLKESKGIESKLDLGSSAYEMEPSTGDIFRVWDLDIPAEEDELDKQLNKALAEISFESIPSTSNDSGVWKDLEEEPLFNLIAGMADLSLNQNFR
jgi:hypothetical protein